MKCLRQFDSLFGDKLGCYVGTPVMLDVEDISKFHRARLVPYALQEMLKMQLKQMEHKVVSKECHMCCPSYAR
jgi:hypothetical protein